MKVAVVYNRNSKNVINLFGVPSQEVIGLKTIKRITDGLKRSGHQVRALEGDKDLVDRLEDFMPRVVKGELPGLVFNVSYGIQGQSRYTHVPSILEMVGIPYVGSGPLAHSLALDKAVAKTIFRQHDIPTPEFMILDSPDYSTRTLAFPLIVKPKSEAVSLGMRVVANDKELRQSADEIFERFRQPVLVEQYIEGREVNISLIGNNPPEMLPSVELIFGSDGPGIYTFEDKTGTSGREIKWNCPAILPVELKEKAEDIALRAFKALGCYDFARVDIRIDERGNLYLLEVNTLPSLGQHGSFTIAAEQAGLDFTSLVGRLVGVASARFFGTPCPTRIAVKKQDLGQSIFGFLVQRRDQIEKRLQEWVSVSSRTDDAPGIHEAQVKLSKSLEELGLRPAKDLSDSRFASVWETQAGLRGGTLLIVHIDTPLALNAPSPAFRRDPEWIYGEGIGVSRAPLVVMEYALRAQRNVRRLHKLPIGVLLYGDEGRECRFSGDIIKAGASSVSRVLVLRPGNVGNRIITQRRGWRKYILTVEGSPRRLGKVYKKRGVLRWVSSRLDELAKLSSREDRLSVAVSEIKTEAFPRMLPHRAIATVLVSFLDVCIADSTERLMHETLGDNEYRWSLERISDRPPMKKKRRNDGLLQSLSRVAKAWEIPIDPESSLYPSVAGLVSPSAAVICGLGPVVRDMDTPNEAIQRISLMQRTLLLAQFLSAVYE